MAGSGSNPLGEALRERGWSYTRLAAELRRHAGGSQLPKAESLVRLISRWVNSHQQPDDFYGDLLAKALGRSGGDLFHDGEPTGSWESPPCLLGCPTMWPTSLGEIQELRRRVLGGGVVSGAVVTIDGPLVWASPRWRCGCPPAVPALPPCAALG
jgi:hypothetical protein